ncbi:uncharacterized protein LOC112591762 [Melanaphis sacchari]|uniref:uncharacterized protein LOC112591762 n=1 Tax=Melanaphis sacchari TaxID=742174 RepID=UPI000DC13427|nr:uncharacterized protein LOC112591762 [Melanaphis sacchari]
MVLYPIMSSNRPSTIERLLTALNCMLVDGFAIQDKTLIEKLLISLQDADALLKTVPINTHCKWFASVLNMYQHQTSLSRNASIHLYAFALKYLAILVKHEDGLVALIETGTLQSMINHLDIGSDLKESSIFNAYMSLLQTLNTHKRGLEYVFQEGLWKVILFTIHGLIVPAKYVEIQSSQYISDLIYKSFDYEMAHCCEPLLKELFYNLHLTDNLIVNHKNIKAFSAYNVYVKTLILSLEKFIGTKYESNVVQNIINKYSLSHVLVNMQSLLDVNDILLKNYMTLHLIFDCFTVWHHSDMEYILKSIFSLMNLPKNIHSYKQINNLYTQAIRYANIKNVHLAANTIFEKELIIGQLIPLNKCTDWLQYSKYGNLKYDRSCINESKYILNYCNNYDFMINEVAISSILNIVDIVHILKQVSLDYLLNFFSTLTEHFLNSDNWLEQNQDRDSIYQKFLEILSYIFLCWAKVIECKLFTEVATQEPLLVPLVQSHSQFFHKSSHNSTLLQNGLKLISTALNKISKENIQCIDHLADFSTLCTTLNNLLLDTRPEIRDSCLQCIRSIVSASKYSSGNFFIKLILEKNMPIAVINTLKHDNDPFVRSKALECLEEMVSVSDIWETSLKDSDLITHCLNLMQCESEGIIRRQIVKLITALFVYNKLGDNLFNEICTVMVHISTKDPLWEVKTFTYEFWNSIIHTFIGESCKQNNTVRLNDSLVKLSATGCLHVLYLALKEEHDLVVQKKAIYLTKRLLTSIKSNNNICDLNFKTKSEPGNCLHNIIDGSIDNSFSSKQKKPRQIDSSDRILNSITTTSDCELLPNLKSFNYSNIYPNDICLRQKTDDYLKIDDFLNFTYTYDFNECDAKTQWIISTRSGLDSMLNDIIDQSQNSFIEGADLLDCH